MEVEAPGNDILYEGNELLTQNTSPKSNNNNAASSTNEHGVTEPTGKRSENLDEDNDLRNVNGPTVMRGAAEIGRYSPLGVVRNNINAIHKNRNNDLNASSAATASASATVAPNGTSSLELWVEAKTDDGKSYFYHALTRETTWNRPEGPFVKVMTQSEIEEVNRKKRTNEQKMIEPNSGVNNDKTGNISQPMPHVAPPVFQPPPHGNMAAPPPNMPNHQGMHFYQNQQSHNFSHPPFGMPPPGYAGYAPPPWAAGGANHWNAGQQQHMHNAPEKPAKNLILKPGVIDPSVIARAAEWTEHRAPDGRPYYYHAGRNESIWEKPQALRDMEAARMAAHSGVAPKQSMPPLNMHMPHMIQPTTANVMHMPPAPVGGVFPPDLNAANYNAAAVTMKNNNDTVLSQMDKELKKVAEEKRKVDSAADQKKDMVGKIVDKSRPISSTPIAGTPWCVVWTGDARVFFYNPSTRTSVWERPEALVDRTDVDKAINMPPDQLKMESVNQAKQNTESEQTSKKQLIKVQQAKQESDIEEHNQMMSHKNENEDDEIIKIRTESESSVEEVPNKKPKISKLNKKADANEALILAEVRAAKERALVPLETRVQQFKEMLREKDVSAFSTWEKELHKIVFDPRYLLLTSKERKQVFEKYVKDRAEEERKEKRNKMRQKRDDFRKLMEDAKLHGKSAFNDFCTRYGKDERYKAIEKSRERESLFNEYLVDVRRREKEEKQQKKEQIRKDFMEMLRERSKDLDRHTRWHEVKKKFESDSRYRAVESSIYREEYFCDFMRQFKEEKRRDRDQKDRERDQKDREREKDRERKINRKEKDRKDKDKNRDRSRSRQKDLTSDGENKSEAHKKSDADAKQAEDDGENSNEKRLEEVDAEEENQQSDTNLELERIQKERERQMRAEQSIREREKEVHRTLAGHLRERDKEREHHKRDEAIGHFNALLVDLVRNADLTWKEVKRQLRKDHRWDLIDSLSREDREKIFHEHIDGLMKKKREKFREMLDELPNIELTSSWKDIKKLIKEDPRYIKFNSSDKCEREFREYVKDKTSHARAALRELLQECKLITYKSIELVRENPNHLKEIQDILKNDKRYLILDHMSEERTSIVISYLEELNKRGPPPPPTASESTRRNK